MKTTARKRAAGFFTVIEMLAVISVVTVLFAMLFPAFSKVRMRTLRTQDLSNMKQFAIACFAMTTDNRAVLPIGARINAYESQGWGDCIEGGGLAGSEWAKLRDCYGLSYRVAGCNQATKPEVFQNNSRSCYRGMSYATAMDSVKISPTLKTAKGYDRTVQLYDDELVLWRSYGNRG